MYTSMNSAFMLVEYHICIHEELKNLEMSVPEKWKKANIAPMFKKNKKEIHI